MAQILLVDDEAQVREVLRLGLESDGHAVTEAANGREAIRAYEGASFDLVITDVLMPDIDGVEFVRELRDKSADCRLLAISGGSTYGGQLLSMMKAFGASETLAKPFTIVDLLGVVDGLLAK